MKSILFAAIATTLAIYAFAAPGKRIHAFPCYKKRHVRKNSLNFGPLETQRLKFYFSKKQEPQNP